MNMSFEWLKAAYSDIAVMDSIVDNEFLTHMTAFHAQQCIEKSLKAILEHHGMNVPRKHDILTLKEMTQSYISIDNDEILDDINDLYIESRYPSDIGLLPYGKPTLRDAKEFYEFAKDILYQIYYNAPKNPNNSPAIHL